MESRLNSEGFIQQYLIAGLREEAFIDHTKDTNQLRYEKYLRSIITRKQDQEPGNGVVELGKTSTLGLPWRYYYNYENWFVDLSTFYSTLTRVEMDACTLLKVEEEMEVRACIWSYASVDLWCNGEHMGGMEPPVYKPIRKQEILLKLKRGENRIYVRLQTLGVRDTRTLFGIQIMERRDEILVVLPDKIHTDPVFACAQWLDQLVLRNGKIVFPGPAPKGTLLGYDSMSPDFAKVKTKVEFHDISGKTEELLEDGRPYLVIKCEAEGQNLTRRVEDTSQIVPKRLKGLDDEKIRWRFITAQRMWKH